MEYRLLIDIQHPSIYTCMFLQCKLFSILKCVCILTCTTFITCFLWKAYIETAHTSKRPFCGTVTCEHRENTCIHIVRVSKYTCILLFKVPYSKYFSYFSIYVGSHLTIKCTLSVLVFIALLFF